MVALGCIRLEFKKSDGTLKATSNKDSFQRGD